jgi:hypothetical protein
VTVLLDRHRTDPLHKRAISDELIDAWPDRYASFEQGDYETFCRLMRIEPTQWPWLKGKVTASGGGVVITRYDPGGSTAPPPYARLDRDVVMQDPKRADGTYRIPKRLHYQYRPGPDPKYIDVHPLAKLRPIRASSWLEGCDVYCCLEGSLKADSVLSDGMPAFSSTSVTTWNGQPLKKMLPLLREASTVYVVPDSDFMASEKYEGSFNPEVLYQTRKVAKYLRYNRVRSMIAFPWLGLEYFDLYGKLGVDDFLYAGYRIEELVTEDPTKDALNLMPALPMTKDAERVVKAILRRNAGEYGAFVIDEIGKAARVHRNTVRNVYLRLQDAGFWQVFPGRSYVDKLGETKRSPAHYYAYRLLPSHREYLRSIPVPPPVRRKMPWLPPANLATVLDLASKRDWHGAPQAPRWGPETN